MSAITAGRRGAFLSLSIVVILAARPVSTYAQDSLRVDTALASSALSVREDAVAQLMTTKTQDISPATRDLLISLLEREAVALNTATLSEATTDDEDEEYPSYLTNLVAVAVRLGDPRALRGLCLAGLGLSGTVQDFVAAHAREALPYLAEAYRAELAQQGVLETSALILRSDSAGLTADERYALLKRIFGARASNPVAFLWSADYGNIVELASVARSMAADTDEIVAYRAAAVSASLRAAAAGLSNSVLLGRTSNWVSVLCAGAAGARKGACESLRGLLDNARAQVARGTPAITNALHAYIKRADDARRLGAFSADETMFLVEDATIILNRA